MDGGRIEALDPLPFVIIFYITITFTMLYLYFQIHQNEIFMLGYQTSKFGFLIESLFLLAIILILPIGGRWRYQKAVKNGEEILDTGLMIKSGIANVKILREDYLIYISLMTMLYASFVFTLYTYSMITTILHINTSYWQKPAHSIPLDALTLIVSMITIAIFLIWVPYHFDKKAKQCLNTQSKT